MQSARFVLLIIAGSSPLTCPLACSPTRTPDAQTQAQAGSIPSTVTVHLSAPSIEVDAALRATSSDGASGLGACNPPPPPSNARLVLKRDQNPFGTGRAYAVEVHPDGKVVYLGKEAVRIRGRSAWTISPGDAATLFAQAACAGASTWKKSYDLGTDDFRAELTVDLGVGAPVVVENNLGCPKNPMFIVQEPDALCALEQAIDAITGVRVATDCADHEGGLTYCDH